MIQFDHVTYAYNADKSKPAIKDITLTVNRGEELAIMGGNGCGKTTLGLLLCGVVKPDSGSVIVDRLANGPNQKSTIGFLFQDPDNGLVATTVEREIAFSLENRNMPPGEMRGIVDRIAALFDMSRYRDRLVWNLSGGEKQRLSLAGLFAAEPKILFLDEPASYLDYPGSRQLDQALDQVRRIDPQLSIVRVTQYPHVAEKHGRVVIMDGGRILKDDTPENVFSDRELLFQSGIRPPLNYLTPISEMRVQEKDFAPVKLNGSELVRIENLSFSYEGDAPVFNDLSLIMHRGEILGLVGISGCGKSTLAQLICGIYEPTSGRIRFADSIYRAVMSFQQPERQFFLDTCYDEIKYGLKGKYESNTLIEKSVRHCMEIVGLDFDAFKSRDPHTLSGGEARRLGFAIVVALDADLIVFDEPTCGLDENGIQAFKRMLVNLKGGGKTVLIISHNSEIIADTVDRVALLNNGKIVAKDSPLEFFASEQYQGILSVPEIISYQQANYKKVFTTHPGDIFDLAHF